jgi:hypothetical protein
MNRVINILTKRKKIEAKKKEKITTITNLFCLLFPGQDNEKVINAESQRAGDSAEK